MADLPSDVDTEQDRVIFIQSLAQFMVNTVEPCILNYPCKPVSVCHDYLVLFSLLGIRQARHTLN